jgi:hydroxymethylpyrimidine pyrophosphatase-like HAD family hydrolase
LLAQVQGSDARERGIPIVVVTRNPTPSFTEALRDLQLPILVDTGQIWSECGVSSTPLVVKVNEGGTVSSKGVTHLVDSIAFG